MLAAEVGLPSQEPALGTFPETLDQTSSYHTSPTSYPALHRPRPSTSARVVSGSSSANKGVYCSLGLACSSLCANRLALPLHSGLLSEGTSSEKASQTPHQPLPPYPTLHFLFLHSPYYCLTLSYTYLFTGGHSMQAPGDTACLLLYSHSISDTSQVPNKHLLKRGTLSKQNKTKDKHYHQTSHHPCQQLFQTREMGLREGVTQPGPWATWVWLQLGWAKKSRDLPLGFGEQSLVAPLFMDQEEGCPRVQDGSYRALTGGRRQSCPRVYLLLLGKPCREGRGNLHAAPACLIVPIITPHYQWLSNFGILSYPLPKKSSLFSFPAMYSPKASQSPP